MEHFGSDLPRDVLELTGLRIDPAHRLDLPELLHSRWFAYWDLHPVAATYLYAAHYREQVRTFAECYVDIETAHDAKAFSPDDIFESRDLTAMWLARSATDRVGCPYPVALAFAQHRALERQFRRYPRPNQLYGEDFELDLADHWRQMCDYSLQYVATDSFAASKHTPGSSPAVVEAHATWLMRQITRRARPHHRLLGRMFREDRLDPRWAARVFTPAEIDAALQHASELGVSHR
jgi:hypothetical protein